MKVLLDRVISGEQPLFISGRLNAIAQRQHADVSIISVIVTAGRLFLLSSRPDDPRASGEGRKIGINAVIKQQSEEQERRKERRHENCSSMKTAACVCVVTWAGVQVANLTDWKAVQVQADTKSSH